MSSCPTTVLVASPNATLRGFIARNLDADGYAVNDAPSTETAFERAATEGAQVLILDHALPAHGALELTRRIRAGAAGGRPDPDALILTLGTPDGGELQCVRALDSGADDHMHDPRSYPELRARVRALARRRTRTDERPLHVGALEVDPRSRLVTIDGRPVEVTNREFELLRALARDPLRVFSRGELLTDLWGYHDGAATRTLDSHACRLRNKLAAHGTDLLVTVRGVGYQLARPGTPAARAAAAS